MRSIVLFGLFIVAVTAAPGERIAGGSATNIESYPSIASLLYTWNWSSYLNACGGIILNNRSILTAAQCPRNDPANRWRVRVGSTNANTGGTVLLVNTMIVHPNFDLDSLINDVAIMRTASSIAFNNAVRPASIAGANYNIADNTGLSAAGWGHNLWGQPSEQLRHVHYQAINQAICRNRYGARGISITDNMFCTGILNVGGRDTCRGDYGGPVYHNNVVVGVISFTMECGSSHFPSVNSRVSRYTSWIQNNA
ncbi:unnamed protein product [Chrysodeixis includens]|uniref:Peptidase S1 domain-containing protein n=1 Tax=Chrysodeixis includens TaxID=689277 RepID=A0A9P0FVA8_CHRIL|nr:unnamed protein product [Chrysodeixis includens]